MKRIIFNFCFVWLAVSAFAGSKVVEMRNYGLVPDTHENLSPKLQKALQDIKSQVALGDKVTLLFESGRYDFHPEGAAVREYYISNHDQDNPKTVGFPLEDWKGLTVDGQGADFIFHGRMLPLSLLRSENCTLRNFSIWLGRKYDILWITIPFFVIGALAGFTNIYKMAKKIYGLGRKDRKK